MTKTVFVSGHLDLTREEFDAHYAPYILSTLADGDNIVVGDARGADEMVQTFIRKWDGIMSYTGTVTIYHMLTIPRFNVARDPMRGGYQSNTAKDAAMTADSDFDIAWVRPEKHSSVSGRVSGTESNLLRRKVGGAK